MKKRPARQWYERLKWWNRRLSSDEEGIYGNDPRETANSE